MRVPETEQLAGSGRPIFYPEGLPGSDSIFPDLARMADLPVEGYVPRALNVEILEARLSARPALFIVPTSVRIDAELLRRVSGRVSVFASVSTGTDHVDLEACAAAGIPFLHAPGVNAQSVAEYVAAAAVHARGRLPEAGETAGIVGYGRIGNAAAVLLRKLGFSVRWYDPFVSDADGSDLAQVLDSDLVTFHVPLTRDGPFPTQSMVDLSYAAKIRGGSVVINTARGNIFTEEAFLEISRKNTSVMDVFPTEPPGEVFADAPAYSTPHIAGYNYSARAGGALAVARQFAGMLGLDMKPDLPLPEFTHNVLDFLPAESARLKEDPTSFSRRREEYPHRGGLDSACTCPAPDLAGKLLREKLCGG